MVLVVSVVLVIIVGVVGSPPDCGVVTVGVVPPCGMVIIIYSFQFCLRTTVCVNLTDWT